MNWWTTDEWSLGNIWRWSDLVQRAILIGLALMLGYSLFVLIRFFLRYRVTRHELRDLDLDARIDSRRRRTQIVVDLSRGLGSLRAITIGAPFLALAGTSYGIMAAF